MQEYYFLFALAFVYALFATIQDLKHREVANWLNFSLIAFALAYRAFYASATNNLNFFLFGVYGFIIMVVLGNVFYYAKAFAGGDAKLLMGFGIILPYQSYMQLILLPILLVFTLFLSGAVYSLIYSIFIVAKNKKAFVKKFNDNVKNKKILLILATALSLLFIIAGIYNAFAFLLAILFLIPLIWAYTRSLEQCLIVLTPPLQLTEGDWLEKEVKIGKTTIKKSVHGLSLKEIQLLKKYSKKVLIKTGIPFVPAFLITLIIIITILIKFPISFIHPIPLNLLP
ncbi:MAG: A24 family peptidase [Nanoarchaeota archaeon]|nr:A24 family peptidase [Nanoarchaeota archaeon]MBU0977003.1 A24 family peptidase [Nanoarchaeota archaeon]